MPTQYTPIYQLPYPQVGDPVKEGAANIEGIAKKLETTLQNGSFPASNPDVASITARLNTLESKTTLRHVEYTATFAIYGGSQPWDLGPWAVDSSRSFNTSFANRTGAPSGAVNISQAGLYVISAVTVPNNTPGTSGLFIRDGSNAVQATGMTTGSAWEYSVTVTMYIPAASTIQVSNFQANSTTNTSRLRITKLS